MDQDLKLREATELVGAYLASQPDAERATAAFGALRMSIVVLWETSGRDVARQVLSGMAESLELLEHPSSH